MRSWVMRSNKNTFSIIIQKKARHQPDRRSLDPTDRGVRAFDRSPAQPAAVGRFDGELVRRPSDLTARFIILWTKETRIDEYQSTGL
jgi:hypothetical protein